MKTTASLLTLALGITAPSLAAWLLAGQTFSSDILCGSYSIAGLFYIATTDYSPRRILTLPHKTAKATASWTRRSLIRPSRGGRALHAEKIAA